MADAKCAGLPSRLFFPFDSETGLVRHGQNRRTNLLARDARELCRTCPVRAECLAYALDERIEYGIWGGLDEVERSRIRRRQSA